MIPILVLLTIAVFIAIDYFFLQRRRRPAPALRTPFEMRMTPPGLFMAPGHTWLHLEPGGTVTLGADRFPGALLEHVDRVELGAVDSDVVPGDTVARLRHNGRTLELRSPVEGKIQVLNDDLAHDPGRVRTDPFGEGWLMRIVPRDLARALRRMFVAEEAERWTYRELDRLRSWLTETLPAGREAAATLPDGGLPMVGLVDQLDDATWDSLVRHLFGSPADGARRTTRR